MEEIDKAVVMKATASSKPANENPNAGLGKKLSSKVREEGELSSSDDDAAAVLSSKSLKLTCKPLASFFFFFFLCICVWSPGKQRKLEENAFSVLPNVKSYFSVADYTH